MDEALFYFNAWIRLLFPNYTDHTQPFNRLFIQAIRYSFRRHCDDYKAKNAPSTFSGDNNRSVNIYNPGRQFFIQLMEKYLHYYKTLCRFDGGD